MGKNIQYTVLFFLLSFIIFSCSTPTPPPRIVPKNISLLQNDFPSSLDPRMIEDRQSLEIVQALFEGLTRYDNKDELQLALAEHYEIYNHGLSYIFYLKPSFWSNHQALTAYDFEYAWQTALDPEKKIPGDRSRLYIIKNAQAYHNGWVSSQELGVKAIDDLTLEINLEHPVPHFLSLLTDPAFFPICKQAVSKEPYNFLEEQSGFISNGPFVIEFTQKNSLLVIKKNPLYWDSEQVSIETLRILTNCEKHVNKDFFETIDLIADPHQCLEPELFANLNKTYKLQTSPGFNHYLYHFNTQKYPFHNKKIRKAFAYAIDKEDLLYTTLRKEQRIANQFIPPAIYKNTQYQNLFEGFNPDKSRQFFKEGLKEIGLKATSFPPITLCFNRSTFHKKISIKIKAQWEKTLPVTIILKEMEWKDYLLDISSGDFQIAKMEYAVFYPDPVDFLEEFIFERNFSHWKSTEFNKLIHTSFYESNLAKRELVLRQAEKLLIDEMIISPVYFSVDTYLVHPKITCFPITKRNLIDFKYLSL